MLSLNEIKFATPPRNFAIAKDYVVRYDSFVGISSLQLSVQRTTSGTCASLTPLKAHSHNLTRAIKFVLYLCSSWSPGLQPVGLRPALRAASRVRWYSDRQYEKVWTSSLTSSIFGRPYCPHLFASSDTRSQRWIS